MYIKTAVAEGTGQKLRDVRLTIRYNLSGVLVCRRNIDPGGLSDRFIPSLQNGLFHNRLLFSGVAVQPKPSATIQQTSRRVGRLLAAGKYRAWMMSSCTCRATVASFVGCRRKPFVATVVVPGRASLKPASSRTFHLARAPIQLHDTVRRADRRWASNLSSSSSWVGPRASARRSRTCFTNGGATTYWDSRLSRTPRNSYRWRLPRRVPGIG